MNTERMLMGMLKVVAISFMCALFVACGDDSTSVKTNENATTLNEETDSDSIVVYETYREFMNKAECSDSTSGNKARVNEFNTVFTCIVTFGLDPGTGWTLSSTEWYAKYDSYNDLKAFYPCKKSFVGNTAWVGDNLSEAVCIYDSLLDVWNWAVASLPIECDESRNGWIYVQNAESKEIERCMQDNRDGTWKWMLTYGTYEDFISSNPSCTHKLAYIIGKDAYSEAISSTNPNKLRYCGWTMIPDATYSSFEEFSAVEMCNEPNEGRGVSVKDVNENYICMPSMTGEKWEWIPAYNSLDELNQYNACNSEMQLGKRAYSIIDDAFYMCIQSWGWQPFFSRSDNVLVCRDSVDETVRKKYCAPNVRMFVFESKSNILYVNEDKEDEVNGVYSNYKCVDLMHTGSMSLQFDFAYWMYPTSYEKGASFMSDDRDRQLYRTVTIGSQTWMAEDLRYGNMDNYEITQRCADYRAFLAIALKGAMYTWKQSKNACPSGWHLPSKAEFETLIETAGGMESANMALRSTEGWQTNGLDSYGFSVKPYAKAGSENFSYYWTSTRVDYEFDQAFGMGIYDESGMRLNEVDIGSKFHVRCVKDAE